MSFPGSLTTIQVTGTYVSAAGTQTSPPSVTTQLNSGVVNASGSMNYGAWIS